MPKRRTTAFRDLGLTLFGAVLALIAARYFNGFEKFGEWAQRYERWQIDEFVVIPIFLGFMFGIYFWRRWKEFKQVVAEHEKVEELLRRTESSNPSGIKELVARTNTNLKPSVASPSARGGALGAGDLWLDMKNFAVYVKGEPLTLTRKEFELLAALASQAGELKSRDELAKEVWVNLNASSSRTIDVHIQRIRAALSKKSDYEYVHTVWGLGYFFEPRSRKPKRSLTNKR